MAGKGGKTSTTRAKGGGYGVGGPAGGEGWGGPARGGGNRPAQPFAVGNQAAKAKRPDRAERRAAREAASDRLEDALWHLAFHASNEMTQVRAAVQLHAICAGRPVARTITVEVDGLANLTDAELREALERST
ncbi:MAG: hypothetical protein ACRYHQ_22815 [Janthinobacterium lividum]